MRDSAAAAMRHSPRGKNKNKISTSLTPQDFSPWPTTQTIPPSPTMSSRQLRKLQQQRELEQAQLQAQEEEESDDEPVIQQKPKASLFASFGALEVEDDQDEQDEDEEEAPEPAHEPKRQPVNIPATKKSKKSKKKKGKNKEKPAEHQDHGNSTDCLLYTSPSPRD